MSIPVISFDREIQVWKYTVGHGQLLLRSVKSSEYPTRIDVFFKGVVQLHLPTHFRGLFITEASEPGIQKLCDLGEPRSFSKDVRVFAVKGSNFLGYVAALVVAFHEDKGDYDAPSFFAENNLL